MKTAYYGSSVTSFVQSSRVQPSRMQPSRRHERFSISRIMTQKDTTLLRYYTERVTLFLPALVAGFFTKRFRKKKQRIRLLRRSLLIFPKDPVKGLLAGVVLDWWLPTLQRKCDAAFLPEHFTAHPAIDRKESFSRSHFALWWFLLKNRYKTVVLLEPQRFRLTAFTLWMAGVRQRAGLTVTDRNPFLNFRYPFNESATHYSHQIRSFFEDITLQKTQAAPSIEKKAPDAVIRRALNMINELGIAKFILVYPVSSVVPVWAVHHYAQLLGQLKQTVLLASLDQASFEKAQAIRDTLYQAGKPAKSILLTGIIDNDFFTALAERAEVVITEDDISAHYAAATGAKVVVLFGPRNERLYAPFSNKVRMVTTQISCRPCIKEGQPFYCDNPEQFACIERITPEQVNTALQQLVHPPKRVVTKTENAP